MARQYAPAMSKQAFKLARPKGNYQAYLGYLQRNRPGWKPPQATRPQHVPPPMRGPLPNYESLLRGLSFETPAQMEARANRMAQTQLKSQRQILAEEYKAMQDDAMRRMQAFAAAGRAAAGMNASLIGQVGSQYQAGADQLNAMAAGGSQMMAGATAADVAAANNALGNVGAPALSIGGPVGAPGIAGETQAGVEAYRGGTLPAGAMANAGGYAQAGMAGQISSQNLRATQEAQAAYMQAMGEAGRSRSTAVKELLAQRPGIVSDYLMKLQDAQRQQVALAQSLIGSSFEKGMTTKQFGQTVKQQGIQNKQWQQEFNQRQQQFNAELRAKLAAEGLSMQQVDASASRVFGYIVNKAGQPVLGANGQPIPVAQHYGKTKSGLTPYQTTRLMQKAQDSAETLFYGYGKDDRGKRVPVTQLGTFDPNNPETWGTGGLDYRQAKTRLQTMGLTPQGADQILGQYYERGDRGRPIFSAPEEKTIKKRVGPKQLAWAKKQIADLYARGEIDTADRMISDLLAGKPLQWVGPR